jgi:hypothetical protein
MTDNTNVIPYEERVKAELQALRAQVSAPSSGKISVKGKTFTLPDGRSSQDPLTAVVLDFVTLRALYEGIYNPNKPADPVCFAINKAISDLSPSLNSSKPQAQDCASCPKAQWGTGNGGRGQACKTQRRLLLVPPDFTDKSPPLTLYVSPSGLKQWDGYVTSLVRDYGKRPIDVVTLIKFDPTQTYPTLQFDMHDINSNVMLAESLRDKYQDILMREFEKDAKAA